MFNFDTNHDYKIKKNFMIIIKKSLKKPLHTLNLNDH